MASNNGNLNGTNTSRVTSAIRELEFTIPSGLSYAIDSLGINIRTLGGIAGLGQPANGGDISIYSGGYGTGTTIVANGGPETLSNGIGVQTATFSGLTLAPGLYRVAWTPSETTGIPSNPISSAATADADPGNDIQNPFVLAGQGANNNGAPGESPIAVVINATAVPEPSSALLLGLAGLGLISRRKR